MIQGSPEWFAARLGRVTASRVADVVAELKKPKKDERWRAERRNYLRELLYERRAARPYQQWQTAAMLRGIELEPRARERYEFEEGYTVRQVGFVPHPTIEMAGASPDGIVECSIRGTGCIEIKCPGKDAHMETLVDDFIDDKYIKQMAWQMACVPELQWADYVSFNPDFADEDQLVVIHVLRDAELISYLEKEVPIFLKELDDEVQRVQEKRAQLTSEAA